MISLFPLVGCNLSYIVDLFAALHELASASARTLLKLKTLLSHLNIVSLADKKKYLCGVPLCWHRYTKIIN